MLSTSADIKTITEEQIQCLKEFVDQKEMVEWARHEVPSTYYSISKQNIELKYDVSLHDKIKTC